MMLIRQLLQWKMAVNLPKLAYKAKRVRQNDVFRTAALSMVTPNMESRNPMDRLYAENKTVKDKIQITIQSNVM